MTDGANRAIDFWFDLASNYSYLSARRITPLAAAAGVTIRWQPFLLGPIFADLGWSTSPFVLQPQKGTYVWHDMRRQCAKYDLPWQRPSVFPRNSVRATRVALLGAREPWIADFVQAIATANFARDEDIASEAVVRDALHALGLDATELLAASQSEAQKLDLRAQAARAKERGIFGAPTFFVGDEMFWGNDRLEDAIELARARSPGAAARQSSRAGSGR